jgi:hypothetical protein
MIKNIIFAKTKIAFVFILLLTTSCKVEQNSIFGVWKPVTILLPESVKKTKSKSDVIFMTFEQSKDMYYHFHSDSTFSLESPKDGEGFKDAKGTFTINGNAIAINIYSTVLKSNIVKLTKNEMHVQSTDSVTIIYEKIRD